MGKVFADITVSLDGFVAGPNPTLEEPLGMRGGELHEWMTGTASFRERHGGSGGQTGVDDEVMAESLLDQGAVVMGRRMFSGGQGPWEDDPNADGWWGDDPPFRAPVFVLTHHAREPVTKEGGTSYTFVTDGVESALEQALAAAGDGNVLVAGGAEAIQEALRTGQIDELQIHVRPLLLGGGTRLFADNPENASVGLEAPRVIESPTVTHLRYRVVN
jgi:dihydrofolate reductase